MGAAVFAMAVTSASCGDDATVGPSNGTTGTSTGTQGGDGGVTGSGTGSTGTSADHGSSTAAGTTAADTLGTSTSAAGDSSSSSGKEGSTSTGAGIFVCDPIDLASALGQVHTGSSVGESNDIPVDCVKFDSVELEFQWTAPFDGSFQIDTLGSNYDTAIMVLQDDCFGAQLACNDDFSAVQSAVLVDAVAGDTLVIVVDAYGGATGQYTLNISEAAPGDCCEAGFFGGCDDNACEALVCAVDPECCSLQWDSVCAQTYAPTLCAQCAPAGSCCFEQADGGCAEPSCEAEICAIDASCCDTQWTQACADLAEQTCAACIPLDCCSPHLGVGCGDLSCEATVCEEWDDWCCNVEWDDWCVELANENCNVCQEPGSCCAANPGAGCVDPDVEACVCASMPECCEGPWTGACAAAVNDLNCGMCAPPDNGCVDFDLGSQLGAVHSGTTVGAGDDALPSCIPPGGEDLVFSWVAPSTSTFVFDTAGSDFDTALSLRSPDCAGAEVSCVGQLGDMFSTTQLDLIEGQPLVISLDGLGAAAGNYVLNINPPPGEGFCCAANGTPGCGSASCEASVCAVDPSCCAVGWTDACAATALQECATCQNLGDCCAPHAEPGCADLICAADVCEFDPFCCDVGWQDFCVENASFACPGLCPM